MKRVTRPNRVPSGMLAMITVAILVGLALLAGCNSNTPAAPPAKPEVNPQKRSPVVPLFIRFSSRPAVTPPTPSPSASNPLLRRKAMATTANPLCGAQVLLPPPSAARSRSSGPAAISPTPLLAASHPATKTSTIRATLPLRFLMSLFSKSIPTRQLQKRGNTAATKCWKKIPPLP